MGQKTEFRSNQRSDVGRGKACGIFCFAFLQFDKGGRWKYHLKRVSELLKTMKIISTASPVFSPPVSEGVLFS